MLIVIHIKFIICIWDNDQHLKKNFLNVDRYPHQVHILLIIISFQQ